MASPKYTRREDGLLEQDSGGYKALVIDPDGSFEREMAPPQNPLALQTGNPLPAAPDPNEVMSVGNVSGPTPHATLTPVEAANKRVQGRATLAAEQTTPLVPAAPVPAPEVVNLPGGTASKTTTDRASGGSVSGVDDASRKAIEAAGAKVDQGTRDVAAQERIAREEIAGQRQKQASQDYMSGFTQQVGALEAEERYKRDYDEAMAGIKQERNTPPDPAKAWGSEKNEWAFIAGLGGALAALDEGVARLQKRGGAQPFDMIDKMVEQSLKQQEADRQQRIQAGLESADTARDEMLKARMQVNDAAAKVLGARKLLASSAEEATMLETEESKRKLAADQAAEERAKALAIKKTTSWQNTSHTVTESAPGGSMLVTPGSERAAVDQKLIQDTLQQAYPNLKPKDAQDQWDEFQKQYIGTSGMREAVSRAQQAIADAATTNDVAGFGPLAKFIPNAFAGASAVEKRQMVGQAASLYIKSISGAAATDKEADRLLTNISGSGDYATMKSGLDGLAALADATDREMQKTKPLLYKTADFLGKRQAEARGAGTAVEKY